MTHHAMGAIVLIVAALSLPARAQASHELIAVLEFKNSLPLAQRSLLGDRERFSEAVRLVLTDELPDAKLMSRAEMQEVASANPLLLDRCDDDDCQALGKLLGADAVVAGEFKRDARRLVLVLQMVDTKTGLIRSKRTAIAPSVDALLAAARSAAHALALEEKSWRAPPAPVER